MVHNIRAKISSWDQISTPVRINMMLVQLEAHHVWDMQAGHQEIGMTLAWPARFDNTESDWSHLVYLYIELA